MNIESVTHPYKSISEITFLDIPNFTIITGVNGAGKSQLLEMVKQTLKPEVRNNRDLPEQHCLKITGANISHEEVHYLGSNFSLNKSNMRSIHDIQSQARQIWAWAVRDKKKDDIDFKQEFNNPKLPSFVTQIGYQKIMNQISEASGNDPSDLEFNDFITYLNHDFPLQGKGNLTDELTQLFMSYQVKYNDLKLDNFTDEEIVKKIGFKPWNIINEIMGKAELGLTCNSPEGVRTLGKYQLLLKNRKGESLQVSDLSSGERVILTTLLWLFSSENCSIVHKLLILDEPDAHLHPKQTKDFLKIINDILIKKYGVRVIMTTHSPSTVALAPEESLFFMNKDGGANERIQKIGKNEAIRELLQGVNSLSILPEKKLQIFVESDIDADVYNLIGKYLAPNLDDDIFLNFIASGIKGKKNGSCEMVKKLTNDLRASGNSFVYGIVDWDLKNKSENGVVVIGEGSRYSIENFILDPVYVGIYLLRDGQISPKQFGLEENFNYLQESLYSEKLLQNVSVFIENTVFGEKNKFDSIRINDFNVPVSKELMEVQGHSYEELLKAKFPHSFVRFTHEGKLKFEVLNKIIKYLPGFLPIEVLGLYLSLQQQ